MFTFTKASQLHAYLRIAFSNISSLSHYQRTQTLNSLTDPPPLSHLNSEVEKKVLLWGKGRCQVLMLGLSDMAKGMERESIETFRDCEREWIKREASQIDFLLSQMKL